MMSTATRREGLADWLSGQEPGSKGRPGDGECRGDEHGRDLVGEPLHRGGGRLCFVDEAHDLGQHRVASDPGGLDGQRAVAVDGRPGHLVIDADRDRHGLAGDHRGIHGGRPVDHEAVDGDLLSGPHHEPHADLQVVDRDLGPVLEPRHPGGEAGEGPDGLSGTALRPGLEPPPEEDQRDDDRGRLEVDVVDVDEQRNGGPGPCRSRPHRDEGVHGGRAVGQVATGHLVERPADPPHHGGGQDAGHPLPAGEPEGRHHRDGDDRHREHDGGDEPTGELRQFPVGGIVVGVVVGHGVAELLDGRAERCSVDPVRVVGHDGPGGRVVDVGLLDALESGEATTDPCGARRTGHAADGNLGRQGRVRRTHV